VARTLAEHRAIALAIRARQADIASAWATVHVGGVEQWLRAAAERGELDVVSDTGDAPGWTAEGPRA
jgi:DNA-binding FadR family transcriptional regulator